MAKISSPSKLAGFATTTVSFEDLLSSDGEQFGFKVGQPYAPLGLQFIPATVEAGANLASSSKHVAVRSATIYDGGYQNFIGWMFWPPQRVVGFYYRAAKASSVKVQALDAAWNLLEEASFKKGEGYAGILRPTADISTVYVFAPNRTYDDANTARLYIDDLAFAHGKYSLPVRVPRGLPSLILGGVRVDGGGMRIGPRGVDPVPPWSGSLTQVLAAARILSDAELLPDGAARTRLTAVARSMMEASLKQLAKEEGRRG